MKSIDPDLTLPSVVASLGGNYSERELLLTIVFHPDTTRIGEAAAVVPHGGHRRWVLGRCSPDFGRTGDGPCAPLDDPHVSRQALALDISKDGVAFEKFRGSSRCRLDGEEFTGSASFDTAALRRGIPLLLGHSIVLMLRLGPRRDTTAASTTGESGLHGSSATMCALRAQVTRAAASDTDVLLLGETGTGKELVAASIHAQSERCDASLVTVNMAAIPPELAAAALFGSKRGAYTGAHQSTQGYFREASGGSLFLDEVGDTPDAVQPLLLRALQEREVQTVGGALQAVDLRVISATDVKIDGADSSFRAALRHRLGGFEIAVPALRRHPEDVGELLRHFIMQFVQDNGSADILPHADSPAITIAAWAEVFHAFVSYSWPGNVRELANFASQLVLASAHELTVPAELLRTLRQHRERASPPPNAGLRRMQDVDFAEFDRAFAACRYEVAAVARRLGVSRQSVYRRIDETPGLCLASELPESELRAVMSAVAGDIQAAAEQLRVSVAGLRARLRNADGA